YHQDEPFAGPGVFTQWEVMREASKHVKVTLDGQGGDEVFAGYRNYHVSYIATLLTKGRLGSFASELWGVAKRFKSATKV
ncbi:MAG: asparagine synthetase B, partial [Anaerolineae bacterium]|nr:asparagine synthetase B [Anaerolineae bacterium]NIN96592.1 asparagine synthetase B [Anaerolineae bacterium]NIQ79622.1 asparagine synthetase B [Anaerolineae bacterium]